MSVPARPGHRPSVAAARLPARVRNRARQDGVLQRYMDEMRGYGLLDAEQELALAREIERLEIELWQALLARKGAPAVVAAAVSPHLHPRSPALAALDQLTRSERATRADARRATHARHALAAAARKLRAADVGRTGLRAAEARLRAAFSADRAAARYFARIARAQAAHERAKHEFVTANLRLVITLVRRYKQSVLSLSDMIQEGNLGLMRAVERFDHRRGYRFSTYASWWIRHNLNRALSDKGRLVRVPVHTLDATIRVERMREADQAKGMPVPETGELARRANISEQTLAFVQAHGLTRQPVSLDHGRGAQRDWTLHDTVVAPEELGQEDAIDRAGRARELERLLARLTPIEAEILRLRFGLGSGTELTLRETGQRYGLSRERIRQIQDEAMGKLRGMIVRDRRSRMRARESRELRPTTGGTRHASGRNAA